MGHRPNVYKTARVGGITVEIRIFAGYDCSADEILAVYHGLAAEAVSEVDDRWFDAS